MKTSSFVAVLIFILMGHQPLFSAQDINNTDEGSIVKDDNIALYKLARSYIDHQNYVGAVRTYTLLLKDFPDNWRIYYLRGILQHRLGRLDEAHSDYSYLVDNNMADGLVFNNLGVISVEKGEWVNARQWFAKAIAQDPGMAEAHNNLAELFMRGQAYDKAAAEFNTVLALERGNTRALYNLGVTYMNMGDFAKAEQLWERALAVNPDDRDIKDILDQTKKQQTAMSIKEN